MRKETGPLLGKEKMSPETMDMMKFYSSKWRSKSVFQVLLHYRAARYQDLVQFSQQVSDLYDFHEERPFNPPLPLPSDFI